MRRSLSSVTKQLLKQKNLNEKKLFNREISFIIKGNPEFIVIYQFCSCPQQANR